MGYKHLFDPVAADEYLSAYNWYREKSEVANETHKLIIITSIFHHRRNPKKKV